MRYHDVAAAALGLIEPGIGDLDQPLSAAALGRDDRCGADADGDEPCRRCLMNHAQILDRSSQTLRHLYRTVQVGPSQQDRELLASVTRREIGVAGGKFSER